MGAIALVGQLALYAGHTGPHTNPARHHRHSLSTDILKLTY